MKREILKTTKNVRTFKTYSKILFFTIFIILLMPFQLKAQEVDWNSEFEQGFTKFQQGDWKDALSHLGKIANALPTLDLDVDSEGMVYFACGVCTQQMGDINQSIQYNSKAITLPIKQTELRIQILSSQLFNYSYLSMNNECEEIINDMIRIYNSKKYIGLASQIMTYYSELGKFSKVIEFEEDIPNFIIPNPNTEIDKISNTIQWNTIYMSLAHSFKELKDFNKALDYCQKSLDTITENNKNNRSVIYSLMSQIYMLQGDKATSLKYQKLSLESEDNKTQISGFPNPAKKDSLEQKKWLADRNLQLGILYNENGLYKESIDCFQKADSLYLLINDTDYHSYALVRLYNAYHIIGNKKQYDKIREKLSSYNKELTFNNLEIAQIVTSQLGKFYREDGNYEKALNAYTNSFKSSKSFYGEGNPKTFPICYELTSIYLQIEDLKGASEYIEYLKNICESHPENREDYISYILLHCELLKQLGHIGHAISLLEDNKVNIDSIDNPELKSLFYSSLGDLYADIGDFKQALTLEILSQSLCEEATGKESVQYAHGLLNLSELYALNNNDSEALQSTLKAIEIIRAKYGIDHPEYYKCLCKLAECYIYTNNEKSKELRKECLILSKKIYGENSIEYAENLIYSIDLSLNPSNEDIEAFLKALEIRRTLGRNFDQHYLSYLNWYSVLLFLKQDWESLLITSNEILKCTREFIRLNFQELSSSQREKLWNTVKNALNGLESYAAQYSQYAVEHSDYSLVNDFGKIAYNTRLIKKGLLLESNKRLSDLIMASSDTNVTQIYHHIEIIKKRLTNSDLNNQDILSLKAQLFSMERELIQRVAPNGEFVDFLSVEWENVQAALTSNEVAIEFFSYPAQDKIQYGAVILSNDSYPLACGLFCEDELTKFTNSDETSFDYNNPNLYRTIWAVLETFSVVRDAQTIYFSADNILNTVAIENLMDFELMKNGGFIGCLQLEK